MPDQGNGWQDAEGHCMSAFYVERISIVMPLDKMWSSSMELDLWSWKSQMENARGLDFFQDLFLIPVKLLHFFFLTS